MGIIPREGDNGLSQLCCIPVVRPVILLMPLSNLLNRETITAFARDVHVSLFGDLIFRCCVEFVPLFGRGIEAWRQKRPCEIT